MPYQLVRATVTVRTTATMLEVLHRGTRVAAHARAHTPGAYSTDPAHRPKSHQRHLEWTPSRLVHWGTSIGAATGAVVAHILASKPHPEMGYRACLGLLSLGKRYGHARLEAAAGRAQTSGAMSYRSIRSILAQGLDHAPPEESVVVETRLPTTHHNVRGPAYYRDADPDLSPTPQLAFLDGDR